MASSGAIWSPEVSPFALDHESAVPSVSKKVSIFFSLSDSGKKDLSGKKDPLGGRRVNMEIV
jgi:hypothetical protein